MNARQERFCLEYSASGNATQAAIAAGYSLKTARSQGQRLLTKADIKARLEELQQEARREKIAAIDAIQTFWTAVLRDTSAKTADRLKASELLAKSQGAFLKPADQQAFQDSDKGEQCDVILYLPDNRRGGGGASGP